jgi:predicted nucleotide-binding protein (sugar kinase/HSP70/actin superfamily)
MDVIVGFGHVHDRLIAAALRGCGRDAIACGPLDNAAVERGRTLLTHGYVHSTCALVGAMSRACAQRPAVALRFVTPGDRCSIHAAELQSALALDHPNSTVVALSPERADASLFRLLGLEWERSAVALIDAITAADVVATVGARMRSSGRDARTTDARLAATISDVERALEQRRPAAHALGPRRASLKAQRGGVAPRARVRLTGELLTTMYDTDLGAGLVRWMESRSVRVDAPMLSEWLLYAAFRASLRGDLLHALRTSLLRSLARNCEALGAAPVSLVDPTEWLDVAEQWMPLSLCSGSGFIELATYLAVDRDRRADLVLSLKPFASITSSAVSDAILRTLERTRRTAFVALELNGDQLAQLESRVELAIDALLFNDRSAR